MLGGGRRADHAQAVSRDSYLLRFALQSPNHILGLPIGQHMFLSAEVNGKPCARAYTPVSSDDEIGYFELLSKARARRFAGKC